MQCPWKCLCGAKVVSITQVSVSPTGVERWKGRCQECYRMCKWLVAHSPREEYLMCDCVADAHTYRMRNKDEAVYAKK